MQKQVGRRCLFPHHENEIAQAEAFTGKEFVKTWIHCAHLKVNGEKSCLECVLWFVGIIVLCVIFALLKA